MGSCCVREKEQHNSNIPPHMQTIRMHRRELLINHQNQRSIHQMSQINNGEASEIDTNHSQNVTPSVRNKIPSPVAKSMRQSHDSVGIQDVNHEEEVLIHYEYHDEGQRQEQDKCSSNQAPLLNLQTMSSKNILNSDSQIEGHEVHLKENESEKQIPQIVVEEDHEDSFSRQLSEQLKANLSNNKQFMATQNSPLANKGELELPINDISSISNFSQRQTFPSKVKKSINLEKVSSSYNRNDSQSSLSVHSTGKLEVAKSRSRQGSPMNIDSDLLTQKQEVFNFQKCDDLLKLQNEAWAIKEEQLKTELKKQETYKMDEEMRKLERKKILKQFTQGMLGGNLFTRSSSNTPMNFSSTQGLSVSSNNISPNSSEHKTNPMRTNSTHFTQQSQSVRSSVLNNNDHNVMPKSINIPTSIFESFKVSHNQQDVEQN